MKCNGCGVKEGRNQYIDIWRLVGAFVIVIFHSYHLDNVSGMPFSSGKMYVEFFFVLTGFFTSQYAITDKNDYVSAIKYTYNKYKHFWIYTIPYAVIVCATQQVLSGGNIRISPFFGAILEGILIIKGNNIGHLWYLVALLPLIPLFCILNTYIPKKWMLFLEICIGIHFHVFFGQYPSHFPIFYYRAFAGLCTGGIAFSMTSIIQRMEIIKQGKIKKESISLIGNLILMCLTSLLAVNRLEYRCAVVGFIVGVSLIISGNGICRYDFEKTIAEFGRKYSFVIYVVHLPLAALVAFISKKYYHFTSLMQMGLYIFSSVMVSVCFRLVVEMVKKWMRNCTLKE